MPCLFHPSFLRYCLAFFLLVGWKSTAFCGETNSNNSASIRTTKRFSIQQDGEEFWLTRPDGKRFFSLGVCCVDGGLSRTNFDLANPGYAAWKYYADSNKWAEATVKRLKSWGFSTIGGWSDFAALQHFREDLAFAPVLHIGSTAGAPWWDMWDPKIIQRMDDVAREQILRLRNDPHLIGYYTDNEMGWWNAILFKMTLEQVSTSGQRQRLLQLLRRNYNNDWTELLRDFDPAPGVDSWQDLDRHGILFLKPGGKGLRIEREFLGLLADRYYSLVRQIIRKYDSRALILGDRYQSFFYPEVVRACAPYVDAVSSNLNAAWSDGSFPRFYIETLHALCRKPVMVGEFYMAANENRSGNKNTSGLFPVVATQKERAAGARNTLRALLRIPYVMGADWFQFYDEPTHGRYDGENFNFGLVDIHNRPYEELINAIEGINLAKLKSEKRKPRLDASEGVPPAPNEPIKNFQPLLALKEWDRERGFVVPASEFPMADLYLCWSKEAIYFGLYAHDVCEDVFYRDKIIRASERAEWVVSLNDRDPIRARVGVGLQPVVNESTIKLTNSSGINGNFRNIACMELPAGMFGRDHFKAGDEIEFASQFNTQCRGYTTEWKGRFKLGRK